MLRATIKNLAARKLRLLTTGIAVLLGVAFMSGTMVLTDTIGRTFDGLFADVNAGTDAFIRHDAPFSSEESDTRQRLDASMVETVRGIDGVATAAGNVEGYAQIIGKDGKTVGGDSIGVTWFADDELNPFDLRDGRGPAGPTEVVIDKASADEGGYEVGDTAGVVTQAGRQDLTITGIVTFGGTDSPAGTSVALFEEAAAQHHLAEPGRIDAIKVVAKDGVSQEEMVERLSASLPDEVEVLTGAEITAEDQDDLEQELSFFKTFMMTFAVIALFVGSFIIYNSFSILVAQRSKEMALLRAIGASRRQVLGSVLFEALAVGLIASLAGLVAGLGVAALLEGLLSAVGLDVPAGATVLSSNNIVVSLVAGIGVSVVSAAFPARRASKIPPIAAMRDVALDRSGSSRARLVAGVVITALGAAGMANGLFGGGAFASVGLGALIVFVGVAVLGPVIARPVSRLIGSPLPRMRGMSGTLARENAMRNPKRTSATAAALMIGVGLVAFITILAASTKASVNASTDKELKGDLVIETGGGPGGLNPDVAERLNDLPEVEAAAAVRYSDVEIGGEARYITGGDPTLLARTIKLEVTSGDLDLGPNEIAVLDTTATEDGLALGDTVEVRFPETGVQQLTVGAIYEESQALDSHLVPLTVYEANVADQFDSAVFITVADGVSLTEARRAIEAVVDAYPMAEVMDREEYKGAAADEVDQMVSLIYGLLFIAVLIALIGIANTLALSIFERTRELGLLRAVGMSRSQLRSTVRWESVIIALLGTAMGLVIGLAFGWAIVGALKDDGMSELVIPVGQLVVVTMIAAVAGVAAAILPAHRAGRLDILDAISAE